MAHLRLFYGQRFKSHTFQVVFDPVKGLKAAIIQKTIKIYLKDCSKEVSAKNRIYFLRGFQSLCHDFINSFFAKPSIVEKHHSLNYLTH